MTAAPTEPAAHREYDQSTVATLLEALLRDHGQMTVSEIRALIVPADAWSDRQVIRQTAHGLAMTDPRFAYDESNRKVSLRNG